jgi:pyruvate kinase
MSEWTVDVDRRIYMGINVGLNRGFINPGNPVVIVTGWKPGSGSTNTMRVIIIRQKNWRSNDCF